jgi:hypothetical protein
VAQNVIDWVWKHSRAVNASLIVLLAIAHEADKEGEAEMGASELASKCRLGERTVQTAVKELAGFGELEARHGGGRGRRTRYRMTPRNPADPAGFEAGNPADPAPIPASNPADPAGFTETPQDLHPFADPPNPAGSAPFTENHRSSGHTNGANPADPAGFEISDVFITSTGIDEVQVKNVPAITSRPDVERLCRHLADRIEANGCKRPAVGKKWRDAARLMIDRDGRTEQQIMTAIDWCQDSEFWRANILSMPKLREKYDQLRMQASRKPGTSRQAETDELFGAAMKRAIAKEGRK